ncbi:acetyl-CoA carboxylase biotin carboxyl carrier protein [Maritimibacter fusiformis]|uniref:Biotin carboxyl carrier protein of acetyl-CoA carboxylase n=1 Tax=Maritimibacter fusiformis TaxID=2603819 RepID=A0A5D0RPH3_9RHOB|nr:acetyl-CoA carboxylase biotin carboxyl carrier protein [Maritimibacter fusiformis]TYB82484.1 acetyl-CoA carboxylase biotin carboxyl carrier protein [Maritimibacter fusiformis]
MTENTRETDVAFIKALAELLRESDLNEIQVKRTYSEDDKMNVYISRGVPVQQAPAMPAPVASAPAAPVAPAAATAAPAAPAGDGDPASHPGAVTSPMVGTVYMQAEPGSPPFVKVGDTVAEGDTVLIVEAMKTMNQIPAPRAGTVKRILVEDGAPVEFGAPLMIIE